MNINKLYTAIKEYEFKYEKNRTWNAINLKIENENLQITIVNYILEYDCSDIDGLKVVVKIENDKIKLLESDNEFNTVEDLMIYLNQELLKKIEKTDLTEFKYPEELVINFEANYKSGWNLELKENYTEEEKLTWLKIKNEVINVLKDFTENLKYQEKEIFYKKVKSKLIENGLVDEDFEEFFKDIKCFNIIYN